MSEVVTLDKPGDERLVRKVVECREDGDEWSLITVDEMVATFGHRWVLVREVVRQAAVMTDEQTRKFGKKWNAARASEWNAACNVGWAAAKEAGRVSAWAAAGDVAGEAAWEVDGKSDEELEDESDEHAAGEAVWDARSAAQYAASALVVCDLVGQHGLTQEHVERLLDPWVEVMGAPLEVTTWAPHQDWTLTMTESTITLEQQQAIVNRLAKIPRLAKGVGTVGSPSSVAAINLALTGELTDEIPECMSGVTGRWVITVQDGAPPKSCRDHPHWRELLPLAAGTGRELEAERLQLIVDWMWDTLALPVVVAAVPGPAKSAWAIMLKERTAAAAVDAAAATRVGGGAVWAVAIAAACAANAAANVAAHAAIAATRAAADAAWADVDAAADAADAARAVAVAAARAADAAADAAIDVAWAVHSFTVDATYAASAAADVARAAVDLVGPSLWPAINPIGLLERLIKIGLNND